MKFLRLISLTIMCCVMLMGDADDQSRLQRIKTCHTTCSQSLTCRKKTWSLIPKPCQMPPAELKTYSSIQNVSLSTVLMCEERQRCSLHLRIQTKLLLKESIHGLSICTTSPELVIPHCRVVSFSRDSREQLSGSVVDVQNDCTKMSPGQEVQITLETVPSYCGTTLTRKYTAPGCTNPDLQDNVPGCIIQFLSRGVWIVAGKLSYRVNAEEKSLSVNVTEMRRGHDYNLRLCHANRFICASAGPLHVIKAEHSVRSVTLSYSKLVPCLCIEGWSAVPDARRVRVCPFRQYMDELWTGLAFDPMEKSLTWLPLCPITATVRLCQKQEDGKCIDLPLTSQNVTKKKVQFIGVESHPQLCVKFSVDSEDWVKCPFAEGRFAAWKLAASPNPEAVTLFSSTPGIFSVELCEVTSADPSRSCQFKANRTVTVETQTSVEIEIPNRVLQSTFCLQVKRADLTYAVTIFHCFDPIIQADTLVSLNPTWVIVPVFVLLIVIVIITLGLHVSLTVHQRTTQKRKTALWPFGKQKDCAAGGVVSTLHSRSASPGEVFIPDSPQNSSTENVNLLCDPQKQ